MNTSQSNSSSQGSQSSASPISNLLFDFVAVLHKKAEGLEACEKYLRDAQQQRSQACVDMLNRIIQQDRQMVMEIQHHLADMFQHSDQFQQSSGQMSSSHMASGQMGSSQMPSSRI